MKTKEELGLELNSLKTKHKTVYTIEAPVSDEDLMNFYTIYLKAPDRNVRAMVGKLASGDTGKAIEAALKNLYIGGDELKDVINNDYSLLSCESAIVEMLSVQKATLKKN